MTKQQYYQYLKTLHLTEKATVEDIKRAYRILVKKYHPDIAGKEKVYVEKFREITKAYKFLLEAQRSFQHHKFEKDSKDAIREILKKRFKIKEYLYFFKRKKRQKTEKTFILKEIFIKEVDPLLLDLPEEELVLRVEGSDNFYVLVEAIKALLKKNSDKANLIIIENFFKYEKQLKEFVLFIMKKRVENLFSILKERLNNSNYETTISIISFLYNLENDKAYEVLRDFVSNNSELHEIKFKKIYLKAKMFLSNSELKIGEKLILSEKVTPFEVILSLAIKEKFNMYKISKILNDCGFITYLQIEKTLQEFKKG